MTPCLGALRQFAPGAEIAVLSEPYSAPLLEGHPEVDRLMVVPPSSGARFRNMLASRKLGFDIGINLHGGPTATLLTALSRPRYSVGYADYRYSWLLKLRAPAPDAILNRRELHAVEQQLALLSWAGIPWPEKPLPLRLSVSEEARESVAAKVEKAGLSRSGFAVIFPAAAAHSKQWPADRFADVVDHLNGFWRMQSAVIAGPGQETTAEQVASSTPGHAAVIAGITLKELVALVSMASLFVGYDSGPMHIAAALGRPIVAVFGASNPRVWHPWTEVPYKTLEPSPAGGDSTDDDNPIARIQTRQVLSAVDEVIEAAVSAGLT
jgi:ADP-heptose:LPS heptosyltransferase